jgi:predicted nucleic acid-binding protein
MIVIDTSVWLDLFLENPERKRLAEALINSIDEKGITIYEPEVFKVELAGVLSRKFKREEVLGFIEDVSTVVDIVSNPTDLAFWTALKTGGRAIDSYFIATAEMTGSLLVSNDRIMVKNALKAGVKAYYLLGEHGELMETLEKNTRNL